MLTKREAQRCDLCDVVDDDVQIVPVSWENEDGTYGPGTTPLLLCARCQEECKS